MASDPGGDANQVVMEPQLDGNPEEPAHSRSSAMRGPYVCVCVVGDSLWESSSRTCTSRVNMADRSLQRDQKR